MTLGNQLTVLNVPSGVKLSNAKQASIADVQSLPFQLFGLDETQSSLVADVSFFRRPSLLAIVAVACSDACADVDADIRSAAAASAPGGSFALDSGADQEPLLYRPASLADAVAKAGLAKSLLAGSSGLADSSHPGLFADIKSAAALPAALSDESGLPEGIVRELRLARALVDRAIASGLLADSEPDALRIDISTVGLSSPQTRRRVAQFAVDLANRLAKAAGPERAFVAMATVSAPAAAAAPALIRVGRSLMAVAAPAASASASDSALNLAADYSADFPVMFNLILWLSVVLALAVYAVAYGLWNIDPGKDSIIYRRGYAHAKKD